MSTKQVGDKIQPLNNRCESFHLLSMAVDFEWSPSKKREVSGVFHFPVYTVSSRFFFEAKVVDCLCR